MKRKINDNYTTKTAATCPVKSNVPVKRIYPLNPHEATVNLVMGKTEAMNLARNIMIVALDDSYCGDIVIAGHKKSHTVKALRYRGYVM